MPSNTPYGRTAGLPSRNARGLWFGGQPCGQAKGRLKPSFPPHT
ncbi:hypothetical protein HMPREF9120_01949 [Neisseria sp. oral taxon 020 str. F0370]|nr:hypothetical protein HMPREF9120_01949 [Neisseria sp. oral taxon 020 str. F0370]